MRSRLRRFDDCLSSTPANSGVAMMQPAAERAAGLEIFRPTRKRKLVRPGIFQRCRSREQPACLAAQNQTQPRRQFACRYFGHPD